MRYLLFLTFLLPAQLASAGRISHLTIYSRGHERFTVYLDGEKKNSQPLDSIRILNLSQDFYRLRIEFEDTAIKVISKRVFQLTDANGRSVDALYEIRRSKKGEMSINFLSQTIWPVYIDPGKPEPAPFPGSIEASLKKKEPSTKPKTAAKETATTLDCKDSTLNDKDFQDALSAVASIKNEDSRLIAVKQVISSNCLTVNNVIRIFSLFPADEKRVEIATYAFPRIVNKGVFFKLKTEFKEEGSFEKLMISVSK